MVGSKNNYKMPFPSGANADLIADSLASSSAADRVCLRFSVLSLTG
jgi:hypothetical protein